MQSLNKRKIVFIILTLIWMVVIWGMSAENGDESGGRSYKIAKKMCQIFVKDFDKLDLDRQEELIGNITYPIRKVAHGTEYCILTLLIAGWMVDYKSRTMRNKAEINKRLRLQIGLSSGLAVIYAASDEIHQLFIPGRAGMFTDVLIDSTGAAIGALALYLILKKKND